MNTNNELEVLRNDLSSSVIKKVLEAKNIDLTDQDAIDKERRHIINLISSMDVRDAAEAMLVAQMIMSYEVSSECINRAHNLEDKSFHKFDKLLVRAHKFFRLYNEQLLALQTYRSPSSRVRIDHMNYYHDKEETKKIDNGNCVDVVL